MATDAKFGIGKFTPNCLQCCASIKVFTMFYSISALMTSTLSVYVASQITTLEKQFGFTSTQSGFLMSCNDIGYLSITLIASYFAEKVHVPRCLSLCTALIGLAGIICAIPYFVSPMYSNIEISNPTTNSSASSYDVMMMASSGQLCERSKMLNESHSQSCSSMSSEQSTVGVASSFTTVAMAIIAIGMIFQGIAKSPRQAFITIYIDNNVDKTKTAVYVGVVTAVAIFGPAIGFGLGGLFSQIYVTLEDVNISPRDPRWIGAWWVGFLMFGIGSVASSLPIMCFPRNFREKPKLQSSSLKNERPVKVMGDFLKSIIGLFRNKLYVVIVFGKCILLITVSGGIVFGPKYMESQFTLPAWKSNLLIGVLRVVPVSVGTFVGGYLTSKKKLSPLSCGRFIVVISFISMIYLALSMMIGCQTEEIIGYNKKAGNSSELCSTNCYCNEEEYFPMCGSDNQNYYSPCHAGCNSKTLEGFGNCTCIGATGTAIPGLCPSNCPMLIPYMVISVVFGLIESTTIMPGLIFTIRAVKEKDKGIAIAFAAFMTTLLGWFLGPVIFGEIIDGCCKIWSSKCGVKGSCALYDNVNFRLAIFGFCLVLRCAVFFLDCIAFLIARKKTDWSIGEHDYEDNKTTIHEKEMIVLDDIDEHKQTVLDDIDEHKQTTIMN